MKVVLFCGGQGLRLREGLEGIPKPMAEIGYRPILWHLMKYYAHYGHKDFILCLGYRADYIKQYFLNYSEALSNDFVLTQGGKQVTLLDSDIDDWKITFVDTGQQANIGARLRAVRSHLEGEKAFLANYSDNVTDFRLPSLIDRFLKSDDVGSFLLVRPRQSFHLVHADDSGRVQNIDPIARSEMWINGGYFIFRPSLFDNMKEGEELVEQPFQRLISQGKLSAHRHDGFWACMDTFKDKQELEQLYASGRAPWEIWKKPRGGGSC